VAPDVRFDIDGTGEDVAAHRGLSSPGAAPYVSAAEGERALSRPAAATGPGHVMIASLPGGGRLGGQSAYPEAESQAFPVRLIEERLRGEPPDFHWAEIAGSVMAPDLADGDQVLIDRRALHPVQPAMFAIDEGMGFTARWLEFIPGSEPRQYRVRCSDDRSSIHDVAADLILVLGRIVWVGHAL
jgi:hypothetical protein